MRCPRCDHENPAGELFCLSCQQRLPRPSAAEYDAIYQEQESKSRARRRHDAIYALVWGLAIGVGTLALALSMEASGGDPTMIALGKQLFWFVGLSWGLAMWWFRRMSAP